MLEVESAVWQESVQHELDTCGLFCPEPVMMLHNIIRDMAPGDVVRVLATDPSTKRDIPKFWSIGYLTRVSRMAGLFT